LPWFEKLNGSLNDKLDEETFRARIKENTRLLNSLTREIVERARKDSPDANADELLRLVNDAEGLGTGTLLFANAA
jgi:hypothetical protein